MPQTPDASGSPKLQARMISGLPLPATTGKASVAPASASLRMSGTGLISLFIGMKPDTTAPGSIARGNGRAAIASAAAARSSRGKASRRASASRRSTALASSIEADEGIQTGAGVRSRDGRRSCDPGNLHK